MMFNRYWFKTGKPPNYPISWEGCIVQFIWFILIFSFPSFSEEFLPPELLQHKLLAHIAFFIFLSLIYFIFLKIYGYDEGKSKKKT